MQSKLFSADIYTQCGC